MRFLLHSAYLAISLSGQAMAAGWLEANGPNGTGGVNSIFVAGDDIYVGAGPGRVFRSSDDGATWSIGSRGLPKVCNPDHFCVSGDAIFMNCRSSGVYRSRDRGASWERADSGIAYPDVNSIVAYGGDIFAGTNDSLYRSSDLGAHWASLPSGLPDPYGYSILGANDSGLFALFGTYGLRRSGDRGVTWEGANAGLEKEFPECLALADGALYLGSNRPTGIFRSLDGGKTWKKYAAGYAAYGPHWLARGSEGLLALSSDRLYRLPPGDSVWSQAPNLTETAGPFAFAAHGSKVFMGRMGGLYRKDGSQGDWIQLTHALATAEVQRLAWMEGDLYAGTVMSGAFRSGDAGATWSQLRDAAGNMTGLSSFAGLGKVRLACCADSAILRSTDGGATWKTAVQGLPADEGFFGLLAVPPYAIVNTSQGFYRTEDSGLTWIPSHTGMPGPAPRLFANQGVLVSGNLQGVYLSDDGGKSWVKQPFFELYDATVTAYVEPYVFAATGHGIFRARVGSDSLAKISVSYGNPACFAYGEGRLFAGMFGGVYETRDFGSTWAPLDTAWVPGSGTATPSILDLEFKDGWLYAGTAGHGVWKYPVSDTVTAGLRDPGMPGRPAARWGGWRREYDVRGARIRGRRVP